MTAPVADHPFGEPEPGEAVAPVFHDPTAGYKPRGRYGRRGDGRWVRIDHIQKEKLMTPTATSAAPAPAHALLTPAAPVYGMSVYDCIVAVSQEMAQTGISKNRNNQQQGYKFRGIDDVLNALSPLLAKYRLVILPRILSRSVVERETRNGGVLFYVTVEAEFDFVSAADGSIHTVKTYGEAMDSADKATNKAMSAAYKYAAFQTFCIPTEGDNDADAVTHDVKPRPSPSPRAVVAAAVRPQAADAASRAADRRGSDEGPDLGTAEPDDLPDGFELIRDYKLDGDWHQVWWGRDGSDGYRLYKTKLAKIGLDAHNAYTERQPVKLHSTKAPFLDRVERLTTMTREEIAATKFRHDDPAFCVKCGQPVQRCECQA